MKLESKVERERDENLTTSMVLAFLRALVSPRVHLSSLCIKLRGLVSVLLFPYQTEVLILEWDHMFKEEFQIMHTRCFPSQKHLLMVMLPTATSSIES